MLLFVSIIYRTSITLAPLQEAEDGLDNKERWHWKERDLRGWVNEWLMAGFVQVCSGCFLPYQTQPATNRLHQPTLLFAPKLGFISANCAMS